VACLSLGGTKEASKSRVSCILGSAWHLPLHSIPFRLRALSPEASLPPSRLQARARRWPISSRSSLDPSCSPPKQPAEVRTTRSACLHVAVSRHPQPQSACLNRWLRERQLSLRRRQNPSLACCRSHCPPGGGLPPALNNHKPTLGLPAMQQVQAAIMPPSGGWPSLPLLPGSCRLCQTSSAAVDKMVGSSIQQRPPLRHAPPPPLARSPCRWLK
jgi:hypothetical protein